MKTIETKAKENYERVIETRKAKEEKKNALSRGIDYEAVNESIIDIISLFGLEYRGDVIDTVILSNTQDVFTITVQNIKGTIREKTRASKKIKKKIKRINSFRLTLNERRFMEQALIKYCKFVVNDDKILILKLNLDIDD